MKAEDAADVLQEVFLVVSQQIASYRHDRPGDTFRGWLRIVTRNKIRDHYRRKDRNPEARGGTDNHLRLFDLHDETAAEPSNQALFNGVFHRALNSIRAEFEDNTWNAFWQATVAERSTADIAHELGTSQAAVRQAKCRVLRRLRQELGDVE